jgi:hypothetical protein
MISLGYAHCTVEPSKIFAKIVWHVSACIYITNRLSLFSCTLKNPGANRFHKLKEPRFISVFSDKNQRVYLVVKATLKKGKLHLLGNTEQYMPQLTVSFSWELSL